MSKPDPALWLEGIPHSAYARLPGWSWSAIKQLELGSPRQVQWYRRTGGTGDTTDRQWLRAVHCLVLEFDAFGRDFVVYDGSRRGNAWKDFALDHTAQTILTRSEFTSAMETAANIRSHRKVAELLAEGRPEVSLTWTDDATGLPCKARIDWIGPRGKLDLKTAGTVVDRQAASKIAQQLWHGQLAHYDDGARAHGCDVPTFIVMAEGRGCQDVAVWELDDGIPDGALHVGRELRARLLARIAECIETYGDPDAAPAGTYTWPGRQERVEPLCLPGWALDDVADEITFGAEEAP